MQGGVTALKPVSGDSKDRWHLQVLGGTVLEVLAGKELQVKRENVFLLDLLFFRC